MVRVLLVRGLLAGLLAGFAAGIFAFLVGEPYVDSAIALEEAVAGDGHHAEELVSRAGQQGGLFLATALYGLALGGLFALAYAFARGRTGPRSDPALAVALAGAGFAAVVLVPFVKYPANPPAVGDPATIGQRTTLYLVAVAIGLLAVAAGAVAHRLAGGAGPRSWLAGGLAFLVPVAVSWAVLPAVDEVAEGFPASLLWNFRLASLGTQVVLWGALGALFAYLSYRAAARAAQPIPV
ncbi:CbtA family protein [Acrocarpospora catenulata]|uniref:CbtA family protein n=1 Tax=Acrocarpospora catenulata TaxID=2836182 RepID=UPI001BDA7BFE|nr:CbtA family protein [Acrocarpospora catenulata]